MAVEGEMVPGSFFVYAPNHGAAIFFTIAFSISGIIHFWQCIHYKVFRMTWLLVLTSFIFAAGFAMRAKGSWDYSNLDVYMGSTILVYMAPPLVELGNFHILGRILYYVPYYAPLHPGRTLTTFGALQLIVEMLNGIGVACWPSSPSSCPLYPSFTVAADAPASIPATSASQSSFFIRAPSLSLCAAYFVFRTVEIFEVYHIAKATAAVVHLSPLLRYEWLFMVFEASPRFVACAIWNIFHPGRYLPHRHRVYLARDGVTERNGPGWANNRSTWKTFADPFGWFQRSKQKEEPFWETDGIEPASRQLA
ncbi:uncharacterized protein L203_104145 [Cryptococcus depauperatus CBS 7841]|uniref:RTA1 domain-containing protein n=1 Tax=Cryptococcus depauperatus CBS 7841 TaxID=1295531 RepID=A0AAJ8M1B9_9TREE